MDQEIKINLSYAYKILAGLGLDDHTYTHLSARSADRKHYYIYPFGLMFQEVQPESLMKISLSGEVVEGRECQYNRTGYVIHGSIYSNKPDINSIFHLHSPPVIAVSSIDEGIMPINQHALHFYNKMSYHEYNSLALTDNAGNKICEDLGDNYNMLLRNHGSVSCGKTIHEAMFYNHHLERACRAQILTLSMNKQIVKIDHEICKKSVFDLLNFEQDLGKRDWDAWIRRFIK